MHNPTKTHSRRLAAPLLALALLAATTTGGAREPFTKEELAAQQAKLKALVDKGFNIWHGSDPATANNGLACGNCHPDGAASNPQTFPKFIPAFDKVVPFRDMINWCIQNPQGGKPYALDSEEMTALEAYAFYLHRGKPIEPGLATRQTTPIVVKSRYGYDRKPSGLGQEK